MIYIYIYIYGYGYVYWEMWLVTYIDWYEIDLKWDMNLHMDEMCMLPVNATGTDIMRNVDCYTCGSIWKLIWLWWCDDWHMYESVTWMMS